MPKKKQGPMIDTQFSTRENLPPMEVYQGKGSSPRKRSERKDLTMSPEEYRAATGRPEKAPLRYPIEVPTTLKKKKFD